MIPYKLQTIQFLKIMKMAYYNCEKACLIASINYCLIVIYACQIL